MKPIVDVLTTDKEHREWVDAKHWVDCDKCGGEGELEICECNLGGTTCNVYDIQHRFVTCDVCDGCKRFDRDPLDCNCWECQDAAFVVEGCDEDGGKKIARYLDQPNNAIIRAAVLAERTGKPHSVFQADKRVFVAFNGEEWRSYD